MRHIRPESYILRNHLVLDRRKYCCGVIQHETFYQATKNCPEFRILKFRAYVREKAHIFIWSKFTPVRVFWRTLHRLIKNESPTDNVYNFILLVISSAGKSSQVYWCLTRTRKHGLSGFCFDMIASWRL